MRHRRLVPLIAAASVAVLAAAGCGSTSAAVTVDDQSISRRDFEDSLDVVFENEAFLSFLFQGATPDQIRGEGEPVGSFPQNYVGTMASRQAEFLVVPSLVEDQGLEITDDDRDSARDTFDSQAPGALDELPGPVRNSYVDGLAALQVLQQEADPDEIEAAYTEAFRSADIRVSSRYGTWNPDELSVDPPAGPRAAPGTDEKLDSPGLPGG